MRFWPLAGVLLALVLAACTRAGGTGDLEVSSSRARGPADAPVTIAEFGDFQ